jgi:hypothetical protein
MEPSKIYLYLAKRDRQGVKVVMVLQGKETPPTRLTDASLMRLTPEILPELQNILHDHRMEWEPWVESASNYEDLRKKLERRGYSNLPLKSQPLHTASSFNNPHVADTRHIGVRKTMLRKAT